MKNTPGTPAAYRHPDDWHHRWESDIVLDTDEVILYGHRSAEEVEADLRRELWEGDEGFVVVEITHDYARTIPVRDGDLPTEIHTGYARGPGAYPVTIVRLTRPEAV